MRLFGLSDLVESTTCLFDFILNVVNQETEGVHAGWLLNYFMYYDDVIDEADTRGRKRLVLDLGIDVAIMQATTY